MELEQAAAFLELARNAMLNIEGVLSVKIFPATLDEDKLEVYVMKNKFDTLSGDVTICCEPETKNGFNFSGKLHKKLHGVNFITLVNAKEFAELYPKTEEAVINHDTT